MSISDVLVYEQWTSQITLTLLKARFRNLGCTHVLVKILGPNNNSKQQVWLANSLNDLTSLPFDSPKPRKGTSKKSESRSAIFHCALKFSWLGPEGVFPAPQAKLVYYPQYPEVRFSGFLQGCVNSPSHLFQIEERGQEPGRVLFLGINESERQIFGFAAGHNNPVVRELSGLAVEKRGVLKYWILQDKTADDPKEALLLELCEVANTGWVKGQHLSKEGLVLYNASNGGGYTLEALLGITSNSRSAPDKHGHEIKQFNVGTFARPRAKEITLMDSIPDGGEFVRLGPSEFIRRYGVRKPSARRFNFTGRHRIGSPPPRTGASLLVSGFDGTEMNAFGSIAVVAKDETVLMEWSFEKLLRHWRRKHSQVVYVPSETRKASTTEGSSREYRYSPDVFLGTGTDFTRFLGAILSGEVKYDPGMHTPDSSSDGELKVRSLFRVNSKNLSSLYDSFEETRACGPI